VVQFDRSDRSDRDLAFHFDKPLPYFTSVDFSYVGNSGKEQKIVRAILLGWPGLIGKSRCIFPRVDPLVSDRSVWYHGKHPRFL